MHLLVFGYLFLRSMLVATNLSWALWLRLIYQRPDYPQPQVGLQPQLPLLPQQRQLHQLRATAKTVELDCRNSLPQ